MGNISLSITETSIRTMVLLAVHIYLYHRYRDRNLAFWAAGWACFEAALLVSLVAQAGLAAGIANPAALIIRLAAAAFLLRGTFGHLGRRPPWWVAVTLATAGAWVIVAASAGAGFTALSLPPAIVQAVAMGTLGVVLVRGAARPSLGSRVAGVVFIVWAFHQLDYPFLRDLPFLGPIGYILTGALSLMGAAALVVGYVDRIEDERTRGEDRFRVVVDSIQEAVITANHSGFVTSVYGGWFAKNGFPAESLVGRDVRDVLDGQHDATVETVLPRVLGGETRQVTLSFQLVGKLRWFAFTASPLRDRFGSIAGVVAVGQDITELVESRSEIAGRLEENRTLLQEIHHRVKNNMQIMASLLTLQSSRMKVPEDRLLMEESSHRIETMAHVHEQLYSSDSMSYIAMGTYISELADRLAQTYDAAGRGITIRAEVEEIRLSIERAVPCAQIVHETISNALKHAFEGREAGTIRVALTNGTPNRATLVIEDDGRGMKPPAPGHRSDSLGLKLVELLSRQLDGDARFENKSGTRFTLVFPKERLVE